MNFLAKLFKEITHVDADTSLSAVIDLITIMIIVFGVFLFVCKFAYTVIQALA